MFGDRTFARDRPSRYEMGKGVGASDAREGQALALRYREGGWGIGCSRGTGPRATVWGRGLGQQTFARDRPSRYGMGTE